MFRFVLSFILFYFTMPTNNELLGRTLWKLGL